MKKKFFLIFTTVLLFCFQLNIKSFAKGSVEAIGRYPDYGYEFLGFDKYEKFNRKMFVFNLKANKYVIRPLNVFWASIMPQYGMDRIDNFYTNMNYPVRLVSSLVQSDFEISKTETERFFINLTLGFAGLYDPAFSKFGILARKEDMGQALAYHNVKQGSYIVLPIVAQGSTRDIMGQVLDLPLNPCSYIVGPISLASTGLSLLNGSAYMQPIFKMADNYADPYEVAKQLNGIERYIKNKNIDRVDFVDRISTSQNVVNVSNVKSPKADVNLYEYNPQGKETDALRTILFDSQKLDKSTWSELSLWNKTFNKKLKISSINVEPDQPKLRYRYILQTNKNAPLAILYPSIGEGIMSNQSAVLAKILYDEGYSVLILASSFNWEFVKSMPENYHPGLPCNDAHYLKLVTSMAINKLQGKYKCKFGKKILVGTSFGALTGLFVAQNEEKDHMLGLSNYVFICPPIQLFYALQQIDKYSNNWQNSASGIKDNASIMTEKVLQVSTKDYNVNPSGLLISLPFTGYESQLAISYAMRQKLYDLVFTIEKGSVSKQNEIYEQLSNMSFYDYAQKYLISTQSKPIDQLSYDSSLYSISDFLRTNKNYKIYHALDDCFTTAEQLSWLKNQTQNKSVLFSNGSHLGFLYRKEFIDSFKEDVKLQKPLHNL